MIVVKALKGHYMVNYKDTLPHEISLLITVFDLNTGVPLNKEHECFILKILDVYGC